MSRISVKVQFYVDPKALITNPLPQVLKNEALSKRAQYLIIFFAAAFLMVMITLLVFVKYHKMDKAKYVAKASQAR